MGTMRDVLSVAIKIEDRAGKIATGIYDEISRACGGRPELEAIMLHAVERKIMDFRYAAERKATS
jgi:hypothetical protein